MHLKLKKKQAEKTCCSGDKTHQ